MRPIYHRPIRFPSHSVSLGGLLLLALLHPAAGQSPPASAPASAPAEEPPLVVANSEGVHLLTARGQLVRTLTKTSAEKPRFMAGKKEVLFLHHDVSVIELRTINLTSGKEALLTKLPRIPESSFFKNEGGDPALDSFMALNVYSDDALVVGPAAVCVRLTDGGSNMEAAAANLRVDLKTKKVKVLELGCAEPTCRRSFPSYLDCDAGPAAPTPAAAAPAPKEYPYFVKDAQLMMRVANGAPKRIANLKSASQMGWDESGGASASQRYVTLQGNMEQESDSLVRRVLLLDRQTGSIYPLREATKVGQSLPWPTPLSRAQLAKIGELDAIDTMLVGADQTFRTMNAGDELLVAPLLIVPGKAIIYLGGDLAF
jgi:hypothetical protein